MYERRPRGQNSTVRAATWAVLAALALFVVAVRVIPNVMASRDSGEGAQDANGASSEEGQTAPAAEYAVNEPFDLTGLRSWTGTMRLCVSAPVLYESAEAAGLETMSTQYHSDWQAVVVDVAVENIDAVCPNDLAESFGAPAFLVSLFRLDIEQDGLTSQLVGYSAPAAEGVSAPGTGWTWVEQGTTGQYRLAYAIVGTRAVGETVAGQRAEDYDAASCDLGLRLLMSEGDDEAALAVELGHATRA